MRHDVILVVLDGLNYSVAHDCMGHLQALCNAGRGQLYRLECELPSLSRPLYECILTGVRPIDSGILHNDVSRRSNQSSLFHYARDAGLTTAAAAYHWVSELYNRTPFDPARDRHTDDESLPIQHGHFYWTDHYPDSHLFTDAEIFGWKRPEARRHAVTRTGTRETSFADLAPGDYVVHVEYGIGRFAGLRKRVLEGNEREYLVIQFAGSDMLYVPIHQADRLSRYVGSNDSEPTLNRLGTAEWSKAKEAAREAAEEAEYGS